LCFFPQKTGRADGGGIYKARGKVSRFNHIKYAHTFLTYFLHAIAECFAHLSHCLGVHLSVCPSITLRYCVKTMQAIITRSTLWGNLMTLLYRDKISCSWVKGFP